MRWLFVLVLFVLSGCGADRPRDAGSNPDARANDAGVIEDASEARDADVPDSGDPDTGVAVPDAGVDVIVEADIVNRAACRDVCQGEGLGCDDDHSWFLGGFVGAGFAEYGPSFEIKNAISCDVVAPATEAENGMTYDLSRLRCACD